MNDNPQPQQQAQSAQPGFAPLTGSASPSREQKLYDALKRIASYTDPEKLDERACEKLGLSVEEALSMAYENVLAEARATIRGMRRPK